VLGTGPCQTIQHWTVNAPCLTKSRAGHRRRARHRACGGKAVSRRGLAGGAARHRGRASGWRDRGFGGSALTEIEQRFGRLDALVNNAGIAVFAPLLETSDDDWKRVLEVNLTGPFFCAKAAVPLMREHGGGAIVNITSISAVRASTLRSAYGTSKAGLAHLTKQLAVELASLGIRVNGVAPGPVETAMAKAVHTPEIRADYHDAIPLNRYGLEEELAEAVFFLCSDRSSYITGQILAVDGGFDAAGIGLPTLRGERRNG
jgi:NAD(P)-dependent dehydrogenase (short-subunit alcohol dehydrogenase family)